MCITSRAYHSKPNAPEYFGGILLEGKFIMGHVKFLREMRLIFFLQYALIKSHLLK